MYMICQSRAHADTLIVKTEDNDIIWEEPYSGRNSEKNHKKTVAKAVRKFYDRHMPPGSLKLNIVGQEVGIAHYMWIVVITRRTTRIRV